MKKRNQKSEIKNQKWHRAISEFSNFRILALLLLLSTVNYQLSTAQAKFYASAPKSVPQNSNFQLSFTIENGNGTNLKPPSVSDFQVLGGPNTSTSMQWVNGNVSQSVTYNYILRPKNQGTFKIGKASIVVSGVTMESNELTIQVTAPVAQQQAQQRRQRNPFDPFDDPFFNGGEPEEEEEPQAASGDIEKQLKDEVFVKLIVNKNSAYKGEMLTASYRLYFRQNLSGFNVTKAPSFDGFWSQEVELDPQRKPSVENINGKQYNTVDILRYNLYPQRAGALSVAGCEVATVAQVQLRSRSVFDFFGRVQQVPLTLKTSSVNVNVKELPENGKPTDFAGAVGKYRFETSLSNKEAKTDEPITYTLKISGTGNLKFVDAPVLTFPQEFEVYDPKTKENISNSADGMSGTKQYDYLIIPRQPGDYKIDSKTFSWFDPSVAKYFTINSPEFTVKVSGEPSKNVNANIPGEVSAKEEVSLVGQDIRYIKTNTPKFEKGNPFFGSAGFVAMYSAPFLLFIGFLVAKRRNEDLAADVIGSKRRRALKLAKKRLSLAAKHLAKTDKKNFYDEVSRATWGYLGDKLNIDMAELSKDNVEEKLLAKNAKAETITKLKSLLNTCELALYSPVGEGSEMKTNYDTAMNLIADIEDEVK